MGNGPARPIRVWPIAALAAAYWICQLGVMLGEMPVFVRFMSGALSSLGFLILFLIVWSTNGTLPGRTRWAGVGLLFGGVAVGAALAHNSYVPFTYIMASVPYALTAAALWLVVARLQPAANRKAVLAAMMLLVFGFFDVVRWEGLDGRLQTSISWRWSTSPEQALLATKSSVEAVPQKPWSLKPGDCPEYRGALRDGVVRGISIDSTWSPAWKQPVGPAWSSIIVVDGHVVTQEQRGESESTVCYDADTGKELWVHGDAVRFSEGISGAGPRATPTFRDGRLYTLGATGLVACLDAATGKAIWTRDLGKEASPPPQWGNSASPLVVDGIVIVFVGGAGARGVVALSAADGSPVWSKLGGKESYSSVQLLQVRGKPQLLAQDVQGMSGMAVADGSVLWKRPNPDSAVIPMLQAGALDDHRFVVTNGSGIALIDLNDAGATEVWATAKYRPYFCNFVLRGGYLYGLDDGVLACIDLKDGSRVWKKGRYGSGQLLLLDEQGLLIVLSEKGELALVEARPQEPGDVVRSPALTGKTWAHPTVAQDRLIVRNGAEMACYKLRLLKTP